MDRRRSPAFFSLLSESYSRLTGQPLVSEGLEDDMAAVWLYESAPFSILAHNTAADPVFTYGNIAAQHLFEYDWNELVGLCSRLSVEQPERADRQRFLEDVRLNGFISGYSGIRISKSGRRFEIVDATVWQLIDKDGVCHGQAAMIPRVIKP